LKHMTTERCHLIEHCLKIFNNHLDFLMRKLADLHAKTYFTNIGLTLKLSRR
jgi:hypothetical protein